MSQSCNTPSNTAPETPQETPEVAQKPQRRQHTPRAKAAPAVKKTGEPSIQMSLSDLKKKSIEELIEMAAAVGMESLARSRKQDVIFNYTSTYVCQLYECTSEWS